MMNSLTDLSGVYIQEYKKKVFREDPKTFEKAHHFAKIPSHLNALTQNLLQSQQVRWASASQDFQKDYIPMDLDQMQAKQPDFQYKKQKSKTRAFITLNIFLGLHISPANPKSAIAWFSIGLIILHGIHGIT